MYFFSALSSVWRMRLTNSGFWFIFFPSMLSIIRKLRELTRIRGLVVAIGIGASRIGKFSMRICLVMPLRPFLEMGGV